MNETKRRSAYLKMARERLAAIQQAEEEARNSVEVVASLGSGKPTIVGKTLKQVGDALKSEGYRMDRATSIGEPGKQKLIVPHKDGYKEAIVKIRKRR